VFTASLLSYLTAAGRTAFVAQLQEAAGWRPVAWVFAEGPGLMAAAGLSAAALDGPLAQRNSRYLTGASLRGPGHHDDQLLALADPYLRWLAPARHGADDFTGSQTTDPPTSDGAPYAMGSPEGRGWVPGPAGAQCLRHGQLVHAGTLRSASVFHCGSGRMT
jgi:hypothetical protein